MNAWDELETRQSNVVLETNAWFRYYMLMLSLRCGSSIFCPKNLDIINLVFRELLFNEFSNPVDFHGSGVSFKYSSLS